MSASIPRLGGPITDQVVEVIAWRGERDLSYGSGYQLSKSIVITARHVVRDAQSIDVRFVGPASRGTVVSAQEVWSGVAESADIALLRIDWPSSMRRKWNVAIPTIGYLSRQIQQRLPFVAVGFPRLKSRKIRESMPSASGDSPSVLRDSEVIFGYIPTQANVKTGFMDLIREEQSLTSPPDWAGMSGAAVFVHGFLVGVESQMQKDAKLSAAPLVNAGRIPSAEKDFDESDQTVLFTTLLASEGIAAQPIPAEPRSIYSARLDAAVPRDFSGRDDELRKLNEFVHSDQGFAWWYADPWSGKTALAAMFSSHPPDDVDVVAYLEAYSRCPVEVQPDNG